MFGQFAQGGTTIPLFQTLGKVGITRPEEQQLFFQYARQHGGYDAATGDFVIPKDKEGFHHAIFFCTFRFALKY